MKTYMALFLVLILVFAFGCSKKVVYMETDTPPGQVPPPPPPPPPPPSQPAPPPEQQSYEPGMEASRPGDVASFERSRMAPEDAPPRHELSAGTMERWRELYNKKEKPRIAVFLNRELSDEVREWVTDSRAVISAEARKTRTKDGSKTETDASGGVSAYSQTHDEQLGRVAPRERWMWAFEDGFLEPFLSSGTRMVDRATIMRLTASASGNQGSAYSPMTVKKVEMDALKKHADLFVEILVTRSPSSLYGYEFKAVAKEVKTGIISANVTSLRWRPEERRRTDVMATSQGYEIVETVEIPPVHEISTDLALDLMNAFIRNWEN